MGSGQAQSPRKGKGTCQEVKLLKLLLELLPLLPPEQSVLLELEQSPVRVCG